MESPTPTHKQSKISHTLPQLHTQPKKRPYPTTPTHTIPIKCHTHPQPGKKGHTQPYPSTPNQKTVIPT